MLNIRRIYTDMYKENYFWLLPKINKENGTVRFDITKTVPFCFFFFGHTVPLRTSRWRQSVGFTRPTSEFSPDSTSRNSNGFGTRPFEFHLMVSTKSPESPSPVTRLSFFSAVHRSRQSPASPISVIICSLALLFIFFGLQLLGNGYFVP